MVSSMEAVGPFPASLLANTEKSLRVHSKDVSSNLINVSSVPSKGMPVIFGV
jgi:hypothetical protein